MRERSHEQIEQISPEVRERAVRMVQEHRNEYPSQWAAIESNLIVAALALTVDDRAQVMRRKLENCEAVELERPVGKDIRSW